jgi:hypothetical protein
MDEVTQALYDFGESTEALQSLNAEVIRQSARRLKALEILLDQGLSHGQIATESGLTRGRIFQLTKGFAARPAKQAVDGEEALHGAAAG